MSSGHDKHSHAYLSDGNKERQRIQIDVGVGVFAIGSFSEVIDEEVETYSIQAVVHRLNEKEYYRCLFQ